MTRRDTHTHACAVCAVRVPCDAPLEDNYDGYPEVVCSVYHLANGTTASVFCEDHRDCECGEPAIDVWDLGDQHAFWLPHVPRKLPVCAECYERRDNYEPPEVTFDDALGARCDEQQRMDEARKLK